MAARQHKLPKYQIKRLCDLLGLQPVKRLSYGESVPDAISDKFVLEAKARAQLPKTILQAMEQAERYVAQDNERIPIVVFHEIGSEYERDLVVLRLKDFRKLLKEGGCSSIESGV